MANMPEVNTGPSRQECDYLLGVYLGMWGTVEAAMMMLIHKLMDTDMTTTQIVILALGEIRRQRELTAELGRHRLSETDAKSLELLMGRLEKAAVRRNRIVHGQWIYWIEKDQKIGRKTSWIRLYRPTQQQDTVELLRGKNPKLNGAYKFPPDQIRRDIETAGSLTRDLGKFTNSVTLKPPKVPLPVEELTPLLQGN